MKWCASDILDNGRYGIVEDCESGIIIVGTSSGLSWANAEKICKAHNGALRLASKPSPAVAEEIMRRLIISIGKTTDEFCAEELRSLLDYVRTAQGKDISDEFVKELFYSVQRGKHPSRAMKEYLAAKGKAGV